MVTEAGKELLRNTINTAKFHNKIKEENEMWKQWELECGLTMMVSDDDILKRFKKSHVCSKHRRRDKSREKSKRSTNMIDPLLATAGSSKADSDRWDHSGFKELYPDRAPSSSSSVSKSDSAKWDHSGYHELYPEKSKSEKSSSSRSHSTKLKRKKKKKHSRHSSSSEDDEIWEDFKKYKRSKSERNKSQSDNEERSSGFDSHVKEWKKMKHKSGFS